MVNTLKLRARIIEKGLTIEKIALKIGCCSHQLGKKIKNKAPMSLSEAKEIATILEIKAEDFVYFFCTDCYEK